MWGHGRMSGFRICPGQGRRSRRLAGRKSFPRAAPDTCARSRMGPPRATCPALAEKFCDPLRGLIWGPSGGYASALMCVCFDGRFARPEQANGPTGRGRRMKRRDRFAPQNRPERKPAERPGRDVLARRANRDARCNAAVRPHGRMRDGPKGRSPLRHAKPSWGGRKAAFGYNGAIPL